ncbi:MAG: hypothetical protein WEA77_03120 [Hyphomonas sp.]|uniref:DUF3617 domain-containing protein n=1 Tax=Hyphomonas sp. TaxID=87 RepID=UPI0034A049BA
MRPILLLAPLCLIEATAIAGPLAVTKGMWAVTSDMYANAQANGAPVEVASERSAIEECWSTDEEAALEEGLVDCFEGCAATDSWTRAHSIDFDLACDFSGVAMYGAAGFAVSKGGDSFVGRMLLSGQTGDGLMMDTEALLIGDRTGVCPAPNWAFGRAALAFLRLRRDLTG